MSRIVRCGLIQASNQESAESPIAKIKQAMIDKHVSMIEDAAKKGVQIICLQELFYGPYFPAEQNPHWYGLVERIPDGTTTRLMQDLARKHEMAMVVPIYEEERTGLYYNTAAVIDADGSYLGKYRKTHIPIARLGRSSTHARQSGFCL
jgi:N-carbamoylputrescine amidase